MSTQATRATLQIVTERLEDNLAEEGLSRAQRESYQHQLELARESLTEVEAIERAAKAWHDAEVNRGRGMVAHDAAATLEAIARDAP